ncbi:hypothetical protein [Streptomyces sp. NPDC002889]|uniref:hypothetical protein n=1 Tax=Streptomyces sp. NPDC002889 TaxID=3364669 RepID=UPI0036B532DF
MTSAAPAPADGVVLRPLAGPDELALFCRLSYTLDHELEDDLATGRRRPGWMWVALRGTRVPARIAWWATADGASTSARRLHLAPREWWRVAELPGSGEPVGFVVPARNYYHHIIAYLGALPTHRGQGSIDEILAEGTRILAAQDVPRIRAATDLADVPMAKAFARGGHVNFGRAINYVWD